MGGTFGKLLKGDFGGFVKDIVRAPVVGPLLTTAAAGALGPVVGQAASSIFGKGSGIANAISQASNPQAVSGLLQQALAGGQITPDQALQFQQMTGGGGGGGGGGTFSQFGGLLSNPQAMLGLAEGLSSAITGGKKGIFGKLPDSPEWNDIISNAQQATSVTGAPLTNQLGEIDTERSRIQGQPIGYGPAWEAASRSNLNAGLNDLNVRLQNQLASSMTNRGLKGGVFNRGMTMANKELLKAMQQGQNELSVAKEEGMLKSRAAQNEIAANLLGLRGNTAGGLSSNMFGSLGTAADFGMNKYKTDAEAYSNAMQGISNMLGQMFGGMAQAPTVSAPTPAPSSNGITPGNFTSWDKINTQQADPAKNTFQKADPTGAFDSVQQALMGLNGMPVIPGNQGIVTNPNSGKLSAQQGGFFTNAPAPARFIPSGGAPGTIGGGPRPAPMYAGSGTADAAAINNLLLRRRAATGR